MKKALALILALVMVFALCACGTAAETPAAPETPAETETPTEGDPLGGTHAVRCQLAGLQLRRRLLREGL